MSVMYPDVIDAMGVGTLSVQCYSLTDSFPAF